MESWQLSEIGSVVEQNSSFEQNMQLIDAELANDVQLLDRAIEDGRTYVFMGNDPND